MSVVTQAHASTMSLIPRKYTRAKDMHIFIIHKRNYGGYEAREGVCDHDDDDVLLLATHIMLYFNRNS
jgi:hypothetical protein